MFYLFLVKTLARVYRGCGGQGCLFKCEKCGYKEDRDIKAAKNDSKNVKNTYGA